MADISKIQVGETTYDIKDQAGRDAFANSKITAIDSTSDNDHIPTAKAVYDYVQASASKAGASEVVEELLGSSTTQISGFSTSDYSNVSGLNSLSPLFEHFYKKSEAYILVANGFANSKNNLYPKAAKVTIDAVDTASTDVGEKDVQLFVGATAENVSYEGYTCELDGVETVVAILLKSETSATINDIIYTFPAGLYIYNNVESQVFVKNIELFYDANPTVETALTNIDARLRSLNTQVSTNTNDITDLKNGTGTSNTTDNVIDLHDYYTVKNIYVNPAAITEEPLAVFDGLYKISDYTRTDGVYRLTNNKFETSLGRTAELSQLMGISNGYAILNIDQNIIIFTEDTITTEETTDPETNETITTEVTVPAGMYANFSEELSSIPAFCLLHLQKKENYLSQKTYKFTENENPLGGIFHKVSDDISVEGLFAALCYDPSSTEEGISYCAGGYLKPSSELDASFSYDTIYFLDSSPLFNFYMQGLPSAIVVTAQTTIPADTEEGADIIFEPGTYLVLQEIPTFELIKLQPKDYELDIDSLFGEVSESGTLMETLITQLVTTGEAVNLTLNTSNLLEGVNVQTLYNELNAIYEHNSNIRIRWGGAVSGITTDTSDIVTPFKYGSSVCAAIQYIVYNNSWMIFNLQIVSYPSGFQLYAKASM